MLFSKCSAGCSVGAAEQAGLCNPAHFSSLPWVTGGRGGRIPRTLLSCRARDSQQSPAGDGEFWQSTQHPSFRPTGRQAISLASGQPPLNAPHASDFPQTRDLGAFPHTSPASPQPGSSFAGELSWQQWLSYFEQADAAAEKKEQLSLELKDAVRQENYSEASQIKAELDALETQDVVLSTRRQLDRALAEERYSDAAALRDVGLVGLAGWWAGHAEDDPVGHLLHITPEYSRWTGRVFRPRDIAEMKVQKPDLFNRLPMHSISSPAKPTGSPILEVFIQRSRRGGAGSSGSEAGTEASYLQQAVSLRLPTSEEVEQRRLKSHTPPSSPSSQALAEVLERQLEQQQACISITDADAAPPRSFGPIVRLNVSIRRDGTARIRPMPPSQPVRSHLSAWEATEAEETLRMLRWSSPSAEPGPSSSSSSSSMRYPESVAVEADEALAAAAMAIPEIPDDVIDISSQNAMSSLDGEDGAVSLGVAEPDLDFIARRHVAGGLYPADDGLEEFYAELMRVPARIEMQSRDQMVFHMPEDPAGGEGRPVGLEGRTMSGMSAVSPTSLLKAELLNSSEEGTSSFEVIIPIARAASRHAASEGSGGVLAAPTDAVAADTLNILADQVAQSMEAKVGHAAPREEIAEALREVVRRVASGEPVSSVDVLLGNGRDRDAAGALLSSAPHLVLPHIQAAAPSPAKTTTMIYKRIPVDHPSTDPLNGLYLGSFGPHGPELLHLARTVVDGEEMVQAIKVTGDAHVPAGLVSFRAKVGRKQRLDAREVYPDELGITTRYKGEGRVAHKGFTEPRWVEGELLVFNSKGNPLTGGAELGFVWAVPGEKRFLILLNRVDLSDVGK